MNRRLVLSVSVVFCLLIFSIQPAFGITRVARTMNVLEFFSGGSTPTGSRRGLPDYDFTINNLLVDVKSNDIYDDSYHLGVSYGQLRQAHYLISLGFRYTKLEVNRLIPLTIDTAVQINGDPSYNQYDIDFNFNYLVTDIMQTQFAPYIGIGFQGGITAVTEPGFESQHQASLGMSVNFGGDLKLWSSMNGRSFMTISSVNNYNIFGSNNRPKYFNVGGALKYYFQP